MTTPHNLYAALRDAQFPAPTSTPQKFLFIPDSTVDRVCLFAYGTAVPSGEAGYAVGAEFLHTDGSAGDLKYVNNGTVSSCSFDPIPTGGPSGAADVGIADDGELITATTVEGALQEVFQHILTAQGHIDIPLSAFRETSSGDVGDTSANGGVLASDTTPVLEGASTTNAQRILWATGNADPIAAAISLPADFDGTAAATVDIICASAGTTDDFDAVIVTNWDGGADVTDTVDDTAATAVHASSATVAAGDIPDAPLSLSVTITPPTHATDIFYLYAVRVRYQKKLLTS